MHRSVLSSRLRWGPLGLAVAGLLACSTPMPPSKPTPAAIGVVPRAAPAASPVSPAAPPPGAFTS
ncbi:MAG TPA: hypothetical protein VGP22_02665, partial [Albitalea sp.]|nr:hypothetical protein [Albitalea sp.]